MISQLSTDTRDVQDNLALAAAATQNQGITQRRTQHKSLDITEPEKQPQVSQQQPPPQPQQPVVVAGETMMKSPELQLMTPLLNFLQLLCENHNIKLQVGVVRGVTFGVDSNRTELF